MTEQGSEGQPNNEEGRERENVTADDRARAAKLYPNQKGWTDTEIEMLKALGHI